jgi:hypothetical protein
MFISGVKIFKRLRQPVMDTSCVLCDVLIEVLYIISRNSIPGQSVWDLWWRKWHWDWVFSVVQLFPCRWNVPYSFSSSKIVSNRTNLRGLRNFKQSDALLDIGNIGQRSILTLFLSVFKRLHYQTNTKCCLFLVSKLIGNAHEIFVHRQGTKVLNERSVVTMIIQWDIFPCGATIPRGPRAPCCWGF